LVVTALAVFWSGIIGPNPVAGSPKQVPEPRILATSLTLHPATAIPGQSIIVSGTGFTLASTAGGAGPNGVHQVTGAGNSTVIVAGIPLESPHVTYPINLDSGGSLTATVIVPVTFATLSAGPETVTITDDRGITASATVTISGRTLTLDPSTSNRGSTVTITGAGFPASNPNGPGVYPVSLDYAGTSVGITTPDSNGAFSANIVVPITPLIPSTNIVTAMVLYKPASSTATHTVPSATLALVPAVGSPGAVIAVSGTNFPPFAPLTSITIGALPIMPSPALFTDSAGGFSVFILVPGFAAGDTTIMASAGGVTAVTLFTVWDPVLAPTRTPTPTPTPSVPPAVALEPLLISDNLLRVWSFDNATKVWTFFDPRPAFAAANTITGMNAGQVYWINVVSDSTLILNGRFRALNSGWNLLSW
jgi:hypothetical protein